MPASPRGDKQRPQYLAAMRRQRGETPNITEVGEGIITPETLRPREGQYNCPSELDWFHVADSHDKREPWMRDQVTRWLQAETAKHRATGGTFGDAEEEVEVRVRDEEVDSFIAAGRNATTQGLEGQMNVLKMLIQAQSRQGVELSEEFLRKRLNALTKWMWGAVKSGQKLGGSPSGATSSVASGSDGGKPRGNDMPPPSTEGTSNGSISWPRRRNRAARGSTRRGHGRGRIAESAGAEPEREPAAGRRRGNSGQNGVRKRKNSGFELHGHGTVQRCSSTDPKQYGRNPQRGHAGEVRENPVNWSTTGI